MSAVATPPRRILIVDDYAPIHRDFAKILGHDSGADELAAAQAALFGEPAPAPTTVAGYELDFADKGEAALELVQRAHATGQPYALAFVDMRMPAGWDGTRTIQELWRAAPDLQIVLCTAYSDVPLGKVSQQLGHADRLLILKKPFEAIEVEQLAASLTEKWRLAHDERQRIEELARARAETAAAQAKGQFLANMSHEIRTPMTAILGYAGVLRDAALPREQQVEYLDSISRSGEHLLAILSDILDISKIEAGRVELEARPFAPAQLLADAEAMLRGTAAGKGIRLAVASDLSVPPLLLGDATRLRQILVNLIGNAIKFTDRGSVLARARARRDAERVELTIEVEDTGIGIAPDALPRLFAPFHQADSTMTRRYGGTGLGLAISQRLARAMGGDISVRSSEGIGTCFTVTVRLPIAKETDVPRSPDAAAANRTPPVTRLHGRVLLVDDAKDNQVLLSLLLRRAGADVTLAIDGEQALQAWAAAAQPFDLIVTDLQMPKVDGYQLARTLRDRGNTVPMLALSAHASADDRARALQAGCDDYLCKPVDNRQLLATCARLLTTLR